MAENRNNHLKDREISSFENPYHVITELEKLKKIGIKGSLRRILEYIAKCNLSKEYPTSDEVEKALEISYSTLKKTLYRSIKNGLLVYYPEKKGRKYRYVLYNMQDYEVIDVSSRKSDNYDNDLDMGKLYQSATLMMSILNDFIEDSHLTFHNICFTTELDDKDDYSHLGWKIPSIKNRAKVHEFRFARHRSCAITVYPNGRIIIDIRCSKAPFDLFNTEGRNELRLACGQVLQEIINETSNYSPLKTDVPNWLVIHIDRAYDIPIREMEDKMNEGKLPHQHSKLSFLRLGVLRLKQLDQMFQFYEKMLPTGPSLRLERRFSFKESKPNIDEFINLLPQS